MTMRNPKVAIAIFFAMRVLVFLVFQLLCARSMLSAAKPEEQDANCRVSTVLFSRWFSGLKRFMSVRM